jgi:DNA-binding CsgD family transcriptional regulator
MGRDSTIRPEDLLADLAVPEFDLPAFVHRLRLGLEAMFRADLSTVFRLSERDGRPEIDFADFDTASRPNLFGEFLQAVRQVDDERFGHFDPRQPTRPDRNLALRRVDLQARDGGAAPLESTAYYKKNILPLDQLRVIVCEEDGALLFMIALFRERPFSTGERDLLQSMTSAIRARASVETRLAQFDAIKAAFGAAFDKLPFPAWITDEAGRVQHKTPQLPPGTTWSEAVAIRSPGMPRCLLRVGTTRKSEPAALTPREHEAVSLVCKGLRNKEIAEVLGISENTVKKLLKAAFRKLEVSTRAELVGVVAEKP